MNRKYTIVMALSLFLLALLLRLTPNISSPFWIDEFSSAIQSRELLSNNFQDSKIRIEHNNILSHLLIAISFALFGESTWSARFPFIFVGSLVPMIIFTLGYVIGRSRIGIIAGVLATFSYLEIVWSQQARGYVLQQLIILASLVIYLKLKKTGSSIYKYLLLLMLTIGFLTHYLFVIFVISLAIFEFLSNIHRYSTKFDRRSLYILTLFVITIGLYYLKNTFIDIATSGLFLSNNLGYYHSFLWREYNLVSFLTIVGIIFSLTDKKNYKLSLMLLGFLILHLIVVTFVFAHHMVKYLLPIFPILLFYMAISIEKISIAATRTIIMNRKTITNLMAFLLTFFIIINGDKFTLLPKKYYSLNMHFREIAVLDYDAIYSLVKKNMDGNTAIVETWIDRPRWYLGNDYQFIYLFRWENESGRVNGHVKKTNYEVINGMKIIPDNRNIGFIGNVEDLEKVIIKHKIGFIFIDDSSLPQDVIQYAEKNLKKELYLDHYPLDENPYSIWPATLYSWGL